MKVDLKIGLWPGDFQLKKIWPLELMSSFLFYRQLNPQAVTHDLLTVREGETKSLIREF